MGCCATRIEDQLKYETPNLETKSLQSLELLIQEETILNNHDSKIPTLSLREVLIKPLKNINKNNTPEGKLLNLLVLQRSLKKKPSDFFKFEASFSEEFDEITVLDSFKSFELDIINVQKPEDYEFLEFLEKLKPFMRKNLDNLAYLFNYELSNNQHFLIKPMISNKKVNVLNNFTIFLYKEYLDIPFHEFIENHVKKPGLFEEKQLLSLLFNFVRIFLNFKTQGLEFEDLTEDFFRFDGKGLGHMKFDPTIRLFLNKKKVLDKKIMVSRLALIILKLVIGKEVIEGNRNEVFERYQEVLTIKYPKLWYFLEKMLDENGISLEELGGKREFLTNNDESLSFLQYFITIETIKANNKEVFEETLDLIDGNVAIFQHLIALDLIKKTMENLYLKEGFFIFDSKIVELRLRSAKIHILLEDYQKAIEDLDFLEKSGLFLENPIMNKLEIKYNRAFCYKSLNKTRKSLDILQEIAKSSLYSVPKIANNDQISEMGVKTLKENLIENKNNEVLNEITENSLYGLNLLKEMAKNSIFGLKALILMAEIYQEKQEFIESKVILQKALSYSQLFYNENTLNNNTKLQLMKNKSFSIKGNIHIDVNNNNNIKAFNATNNNGNNNNNNGNNNNNNGNNNNNNGNNNNDGNNSNIYNKNNDFLLEIHSVQADIFELLSRQSMLNEEDFVEALEFMKKAHKLRKPIYNSESLLMIRSYKYLAISFLNVGELKEALKSIAKNLSLLKTLESLSPFSKSLIKLRKLQAESLKLRSKIEIELNEPEKAEKTYKLVLEIYEEIDGFYSPALVIELQGLAGFYSNCNAYNKALETFKISAEIIKNVYGEKSPEMAEHWYLMGEFYEENAKYSEGVEAFLESLNRKLEIYGGINVKMIDLLMKISKNYEFLGFNTKACEFAEKGLELMKEKIGVNLLNIHQINGKKKGENSPKNKKKNMEIKKTHSVHLKEDKLMIIECLFRLGGLYRKMGLISKSRDCFNEEKRFSAAS